MRTLTEKRRKKNKCAMRKCKAKQCEALEFDDICLNGAVCAVSWSLIQSRHPYGESEKSKKLDCRVIGCILVDGGT